MGRLTAVVFDWGGTLAAHVAVDIHGLWRAAAEHLAGVSGRDADQLRTALVAADIEALLRERPECESYRLVDVLDALALGVPESDLEVAGRHYLQAWREVVRHEDDAVATLRTLKGHGLGIGLLSNTHWPADVHDGLLDRDGLAEWIDVCAYTSDLTRTKPHPEAFMVVLDRLGVRPADAVFVGDRPRDDVWGAQQVGMRAVWRRHPKAPSLDGVVPDAVIDELSELPGVLAAWR